MAVATKLITIAETDKTLLTFGISLKMCSRYFFMIE